MLFFCELECGRQDLLGGGLTIDKNGMAWLEFVMSKVPGDSFFLV